MCLRCSTIFTSLLSLLFSLSLALRKILDEGAIDDHLLGETLIDAVALRRVQLLAVEILDAVVEALARRVEEVLGAGLEVDHLLAVD